MPIVRPAADQFDEDGDLTIVHRPTGRRYSTYAYDVVSAEIDLHVHLNRDQDEDRNEFDLGELDRFAAVLLGDKLRRQVTKS